MRKSLFLILTLLLSLNLTSCHNRAQNKQQITVHDIVGKWKICTSEGKYIHIGGTTFMNCAILKLNKDGTAFYKRRNTWIKATPWHLCGNDLSFKIGNPIVSFGNTLHFLRREKGCLIFQDKNYKSIYEFCPYQNSD